MLTPRHEKEQGSRFFPGSVCVASLAALLKRSSNHNLALLCVISLTWVSVTYNQLKSPGGLMRKKWLAGPKAQLS